MKVATDGLVIREQYTGESDRIVTLLTREFGIVRAFATGARNIKNRNHAATQLLSYGRFVLYQKKDVWRVGEAEPIALFFELREDIEKISLAQYFCELCGAVAPEGVDCTDYLSLTLNSLKLIIDAKIPLKQIKSVYELYILSLSGYMPDLSCCSRCQKTDSSFLLDYKEGCIVCADHISVYDINVFNSGYGAITNGALTAMRYVLSSEIKKAFSFSLSEQSLDDLKMLSESYLKTQLERSFKTLDFYNSL